MGDPAQFPEPSLNPAAYPWARAVMQRLVTVENQSAKNADGVAGAAQTGLSLTRRKADRGAMIPKGAWSGTQTYDRGQLGTAHYFWNFGDGVIPPWWTTQGVSIGASTYDDALAATNHAPAPLQPRDGVALVLTATPGHDAYIDIPIPLDRTAAGRMTVRFDHNQNAYAYDGNPNPNPLPGPDPTFLLTPIAPDATGYVIHTTSAGGTAAAMNNATGTGGSGQDLGGLGADLGYGHWIFGIGTTGASVSCTIDTLELAIGASYFPTAGALGTDTLHETFRGSPQWTGPGHQQGDTVTYQGSLWTALTNTDGTPPSNNGQWLQVAGGNTIADNFAGAWTP